MGFDPSWALLAAAPAIRRLSIGFIAAPPRPLLLRSGPWRDPMAAVPVAVGFVAEATGGVQEGVLDIRQPAAVKSLAEVLRRAALVEVHDLVPLVYALAATGGVDATDLRCLQWLDTRVADRAIRLGHHEIDPGDGLASCVRRYGVRHIPFVWSPDAPVQDTQPAGTGELPSGVRRQALAMAMATARVADRLQQQVAPRLWSYLMVHEMPAALEHALIALRGVKLDENRCRRLTIAVADLSQALREQLSTFGLSDADSHRALEGWLRQEGLLDAFDNFGGSYVLDDDALKEVKHLHVAIPILRRLRRISDLDGKAWLRGKMTSRDGRVHPEHLIMQAPTSRSSTRLPELTSIPKALRPIVIPEPGNGIIELDYKGMEILIAALRYGDERLLAAYATGDVISRLAQVIFPELTPLSLADIARVHDDERSRAKTITYGTIYGRKARTLSRKLRVPRWRGQQLVNRLMEFCPRVAAGMRAMVDRAQVEGHIPIGFGLTRHLTDEERSQPWKVETLAKNTPIQGLAACAFRRALVLVNRAIQPMRGSIILPVHDAVVIEAPLKVLGEVAVVAECAMVEALSTLGGGAHPLVDTQMSEPTCWNKRGSVKSFEDYLRIDTASM